MNIIPQSQKGFTLIELVIVIVLLGILSAVAIPRFFDLRTEARLAATQGVVGAISSASASNYAARLVGSPQAVTINQTNVCTNAILSPLLTGGLPAGYTVGGTGDCSGAATASVTCTVTATGGTPVPAAVICARP